MNTQTHTLTHILDHCRGWRPPLLAGTVAALLTGLLVFCLPNYYRSEAKILPTDSKVSGSLGQFAAAAAALGVGLPGQDTPDLNYVDILNSRTVREDILQHSLVYQMRSWRLGADKQKNGTVYEYLKAQNLDRAVEEFGSIFFVSRDLRTKVITVSVETKSPELSRLIIQRALIDLENVVSEKGRQKGREKARFVEARLGDARMALLTSEGAFRNFLESNRNYQSSLEPTIRLTGIRLEAELRLRQQLVQNLALTYEQALLEEKNDIPIVNVLDPPNLPLEKSRPKRFVFVVMAFFLITLGVWAWSNRGRLRALVLN